MSQSENSRASVESFIERLFSSATYFGTTFLKLCEDGCSAEQLAIHLFVVCTCAKTDLRAKKIGIRPVPLGTARGVSKSELKKLPARLRSIADLIERVNRTPLAPTVDIRLAAEDPDRQFSRKGLLWLYEKLPDTLNMYATHFERFSTFPSKILKRLTTTHTEALRLLHYVEKSTGSPQCEKIASLLDAGFYAACPPKKSSPPRFFSESGLAKLYQRHGNLLG